jgi:2-succinyl-5-enolpyruvyl-6-hydroxy-3-cyclohexene-1-carboxylate synthase
VAFFANRGANGIDGLVSTFYGISSGAAEAWMIVGDLSTLYDLSAPWIAEQLPAGNRRIVIINNGGGKIFSRVESLRSLAAEARGMIENRHGIDFEPWAQLWKLAYRCVAKPDDLRDLPDGDVIIEVIPDAEQTEAFWQAWQARSADG